MGVGGDPNFSNALLSLDWAMLRPNRHDRRMAATAHDDRLHGWDAGARRLDEAASVRAFGGLALLDRRAGEGEGMKQLSRLIFEHAPLIPFWAAFFAGFVVIASDGAVYRTRAGDEYLEGLDR